MNICDNILCTYNIDSVINGHSEQKQPSHDEVGQQIAEDVHRLSDIVTRSQGMVIRYIYVRLSIVNIYNLSIV